LTRGRERFYKEGLAPLLNTPPQYQPRKGRGEGACTEIEMNQWSAECGCEVGEGDDVGEGYPLDDRILRSDC